MSNIFANLELPVNAVIRLDLRLPTSRAQEKLERDEAVREVRRAVQAWYYETYC